MSNRTYTEREMRLALEWAALTFPGRRVISRYRILPGPLPELPGQTPDQVRQLLKPTGLMADLVIEEPEITYLVEAKVDNETQAIGQLLYYKFLMERYPGLQDVRTSNLMPLILVARMIPHLEEFAANYGVGVARYTPEWILPFLENGYR